MVRTWALVGAALIGSAGVAQAATQPLYEPPAAWVKPVPIPAPGANADSSATEILLQNEQTRFGADEDDVYTESAVRIVAAQGLSDAGNYILPWNPDTETLVIHRLNILRGGQVIDLLKGGKAVTVLRRETNLERATLDGTLTATVQPEGLQVGDVIDLAYTRRRRDPVLKGWSEGFMGFARPGVIQHAYLSAQWPKSKPIRWRATDGIGQPAVSQTADGGQLVVDRTLAEAPKAPRGAPGRFSELAEVELSQYGAWSDVSALMAPLYVKAATLPANSPVRAEIEKIRAASPDPKLRAMAALRLVEEKVRYVFLGLDNGGYIPADADVTWERRYGDCKGKTALLLAILEALGIDAEPALVSTGVGDGMDERLPSLGLFDHVMVRARIAGKTYWLDGTRLGDVRLDDLPIPDFHWALPVQASGASLERLAPAPYAEPHFETRLRIDASAGLDNPAKIHAETLLRGEEALSLHLGLDSIARAEAERKLREYWRKAEAWVDAAKVDFAYDEAHGTMTLVMDGSAVLSWSKAGDIREYGIGDSAVGGDISFAREPGPHRDDAPFAVRYPAYDRQTVTLTLPDKGVQFGVANAEPIDQTVLGVAYHRAVTNTGTTLVVETSTRSVAPEVRATAAEAQAASATLRGWAQHEVVVRARPVALAQSPAPPQLQPALKADLDRCAAGAPDVAIAACATAMAAVAAMDLDAPKKAAALVLIRQARARDYLRHGDLAKAAEDYDEALKLRPDEAIADYDHALTLTPKSANALYERGLAKRRKGDASGSAVDIAAAKALQPKVAETYDRMGLTP